MENEVLSAVIMCGGMGTRLSAVTGELPKAMVNIRNTDHLYHGQAKDTILEHQMRVLSENGVTNFILVVGNKKEFIKNAFTNDIINKNIPNKNVNITYFEESSPLGTGGAFCSKTLQDLIPGKDFLFIYSDTLFDINVQDMYKHHLKENADATVLISPCSEPDDRPLFTIQNGTNEIVSMMPKQGKNDGPRTCLFSNTPKNGLMIINKSVFRELPSNPSYMDMEEGILSKAIYDSDFKVSAWTSPCYVKDIGTVDRFYEGVADLAEAIPQSRNPEKEEQICVLFQEKDLININKEGNAVIDERIAQSISVLNGCGVITLLNKNNPKINVYEQEDMIIDTLLYRSGHGAFFNGRFESDDIEHLYDCMSAWNIPKQNLFSVAKNEEGKVDTFNFIEGHIDTTNDFVYSVCRVMTQGMSKVEDDAITQLINAVEEI